MIFICIIITISCRLFHSLERPVEGRYKPPPRVWTAGGFSQQFRHCHVRLLIGVVWPALVLPSPLFFYSTLHDGLAEDLMPCDSQINSGEGRILATLRPCSVHSCLFCASRRCFIINIKIFKKYIYLLKFLCK